MGVVIAFEKLGENVLTWAVKYYPRDAAKLHFQHSNSCVQVGSVSKQVKLHHFHPGHFHLTEEATSSLINL